MNYIIITGASRGLGEAISQGLLKSGNHLILISRKINRELTDMGEKENVPVDYLEYDLSDTSHLDSLMGQIFDKIDAKAAESIHLINNAAVLNPMRPIEKCEPDEILTHLNVNLLSPVILTSLFIKYTKTFKVEKRIVNISSGAGKKPYSGWSLYCSSKAGIDLFTRCVGVEQDTQDYPVKIISFAPGIVDTNMQKQIRSSDEDDFPLVEKFIKYKEEEKLLTPDFVAKRVIALLSSSDFNQGGVVDVSDFI